jgi:hypothetical protein
MIIQRHYEPDSEPLDRVVEILYRLLVDVPDSRTENKTGLVEPQPSTCVSEEFE